MIAHKGNKVSAKEKAKAILREFVSSEVILDQHEMTDREISLVLGQLERLRERLYRVVGTPGGNGHTETAEDVDPDSTQEVAPDTTTV